MHTNRLANETSPYLLQHAHNPVDWYAWGPEAFEAARQQDKPIFLSVGYSTCYWCHVMERQSFENEAIAAEMNRLFINIKVDREERPDVDQLYMTAVQLLTRHGGWPMSVFLTPALEPFYGGTYFPPTDMHGRPGFVTILRAIEEAYRQRPGDVRKTTGQLTGMLRQLAEPRTPGEAITIGPEFINSLIDRTIDDYDPVHGGFGGAPKFPRQTVLELLLVHRDLFPDDPANQQRLKMLTHTLDALANGGIRDHLGGGFHRYSTDAKWLVPHFEIMLYDNAMLGWIYTEAYRQTGNAHYAKIARGVFDFILREMTSPEGAFYTAFDAEVDAQEGMPYLWTKQEIEAVLAGGTGVPPVALNEEHGRGTRATTFSDVDIQLFLRAYGVDRGPNFSDPHQGNGEPDKNVLFLEKALNDSTDARLEPMRRKLHAARLSRKQPLLDTKILTSWNALMIRAMAHGGKVLGEPRYVAAGEKAAGFLLGHHYRNGRLYRTSRAGSEAKYAGFLDDYAVLIDALLALGQRERAGELAQAMVGEFSKFEISDLKLQTPTPALPRSTERGGNAGGFYFTSERATDLIIRQKTGTDSPLPSGNGVAARVMLDLGKTEIARDTLAAFAQVMEDNGEGMSALVHAAARYVHGHGSLVVEPAGAPVDRPVSPTELAMRVVSVKTAWNGPRELHVNLSIERGFHIHAHVAAPGLIATELRVIAADVEYPAGEERTFAFSDGPIRVYDGQVTVVVRFKAASQEAVRMNLIYQACDESACLPAVTKGIEIGA